MSLKVEYHREIGCVTINKKNYTYKELKNKNKSSIEMTIFKTLKGILNK